MFPTSLERKQNKQTEGLKLLLDLKEIFNKHYLKVQIDIIFLISPLSVIFDIISLHINYIQTYRL